MKTVRFSLTFTILAALSSLLILTWLLLSLTSFWISEKDVIAQKSEEGRILLATFINLLPRKMSDLNSSSAACRLADSFAAERNFNGVLVVDRNLNELYRNHDPSGVGPYFQEVLEKGVESHSISRNRLYISRYAPIWDGSRIVGAARLTLSLVPEYRRLNSSRHLYLTYFALLFIILLGFGYYIMSRCIVLPMKRLLSSTERITAGELDFHIPVPGSRELAELAEAFNAMVDTLRGKRDEVETHILSLKQINTELEEAREETIRSEKMASVGLLAAGTAHEIGTPLASIIGYADIMREETCYNTEMTDYISRIQEGAGRIDQIVRALLDFARPAPPEREEVDVAELLRDTLSMLEGQGAFRNVSVTIDVASNLPPVISDRNELQLVFTNLLINARDAMPNGGRLVVKAFTDEGGFRAESAEVSSVTVRGRRRSDFQGAFRARIQPGDGNRCLRMEVSDTGMGIAPENMEKIFDPFFTTKEPGRGTGLGLAVTARIIDSLGGRITVESDQSKGSTFTVWLPIE